VKIRADVASLLHAGLSDRAIARELHTDARAVATARQVLGLPRVKSGSKPAASPEDAFRSRTRETDGGHLTWTGHVNNTGTPALRHGGRLLSAYRIAFRIRTGREPVGYARPGCGRPGCVAPDHIDDQPARDRNNATFNALFGGAS
jgi:hypothetical protein